MNFPTWTNKGRMTNKQKAVARLRYLINRLAAEHGPRATISELAKVIGLNHSTISLYIARGAFSESTATLMEKKFGRDLIRAEYLTDPLSIR